LYKANISIITTKSVLFRPWNILALNSNHAFARYIVHVGLCNIFIIFIFTHLFCSYIVSTVLNEVSLVRYVQLIGRIPNLGPLLKTRTVEVGFEACTHEHQLCDQKWTSLDLFLFMNAIISIMYHFTPTMHAWI
jgi:hypothetical protein